MKTKRFFTMLTVMTVIGTGTMFAGNPHNKDSRRDNSRREVKEVRMNHRNTHPSNRPAPVRLEVVHHGPVATPVPPRPVPPRPVHVAPAPVPAPVPVTPGVVIGSAIGALVGALVSK